MSPILILLLIFQISKSEIKFSFTRDKKIYENIPSGKEPMDYYMKNILETKIKLGDSLQEVPIKLDSDVYSTSVLGEESKDLNKLPHFKKNNSKTYKVIKEEKVISSTGFISGEISSETFQFKLNETDTSFDNITFFYGIIDTKPENSGYLGLSISYSKPDYDLFSEISFPIQLKKKNITDNYAFQLEFIDDENGYLTIGKNNYDPTSSLLNKTKIEPISGFIQYWAIAFDSIKYDTFSVIKNNSTVSNILKFDFNINYLRTNSQYNNTIYENFFKEKIEKKECYKKVLEGYFYYYCNKSTDVSKMKDLVFFNKNMDRNFTLTYEDLFYEDKENNYFLVIFPIEIDDDDDYFSVGFPFLKKYSLLFDSNNKIIAFMKEREKKFPIWKIILIIVGFAIICFLIFIIIFILKKPKRKPRKNELDDDYDYDTQNDDKNKLTGEYNKI